jgi:hypothetical protein
MITTVGKLLFIEDIIILYYAKQCTERKYNNLNETHIEQGFIKEEKVGFIIYFMPL